MDVTVQSTSHDSTVTNEGLREVEQSTSNVGCIQHVGVSL